MINKGRVRWLIKADVVAQVKFIHKVFGVGWLIESQTRLCREFRNGA
jgi:hypothetical protein